MKLFNRSERLKERLKGSQNLSPSEVNSAEDAKIWTIAAAGPTVWHVTNGDQVVELAFPIIHKAHRLEIEKHRSSQTHVFDLDVNGKVKRISVRSLTSEVVDGSPGVMVSLEADGFWVRVDEVGCAWYKPSVGIRTWGFSDSEWELAMVWLVGTLFVTGFPHIMD